MRHKVAHIMTLADLTPAQISQVVTHARFLKQVSLPWLAPSNRIEKKLHMPSQSLFSKSIALLFNKRSTRTRIAAETAATLLGGRALFLGQEDIQLGVNESVRDSARVIGGMCQGIFARVGDHEEIEELAKYSPVPVLNALSSLWHPTQVLADLLTLQEHAHLFDPTHMTQPVPSDAELMQTTKTRKFVPLPQLRPLTIAYVGDSANVLHDMLVTYPRLGHSLRVATPAQEKYRAPTEVWDRVVKLGCDQQIVWVTDPREAVHSADVVVTDTWVSMGQEAEKAERLEAFKGYQVTEKLCEEGGANPDWKFLHCLPRKEHEVDDEVFYGPRSLVFPEADNRKWTIMALFEYV
ncbi:mitochondrial ornithine carbamoyltransferase [Irpex rosettiformis]|uniref:Mitochondrial ornithine carbamoyltransferase n=1 Tax=Irpex rosettiformis TaxID=378272 RepID=A0ACB8TQP0_9APHY|nr:mitochondrial ornithine carbamoyltransferase [Irpex rosettiformis]